MLVILHKCVSCGTHHPPQAIKAWTNESAWMKEPSDEQPWSFSLSTLKEELIELAGQ